jgi:hypothetical protein
MAVRNDNYGGDFALRLQRCIDWNTRWLEHHEIDSEVLMVNWNPLPDSQSLLKQLNWPDKRRHVSYNMVDVPSEIHTRYVDPAIRDTVPMFEFIAKNAGIRRAVGEYVLCINADILIHPDIFRHIASKKLVDTTYYRANRLDFRDKQAIGVKEFIHSGFAISLKGFMYRYSEGLSKEFQYNWFIAYNALRLKWELFKFSSANVCNKIGLNVVHDNGAYLAHCLNSGDFMLMASTNWNQMKAYPEYTNISTHTDALFTLLASTKWKEQVFSEPIFHQEHERRYTWDAIKHEPKFEKAYRFFEDVANVVKQNGSVDEFLNEADWGLKNFELEEHRF